MSRQPSPKIIREATLQDWGALANLLHFNFYVHRHMDFRPALEWLGHRPFFLLAQEEKITAALACPPDPPQVAWIRLFAVSHDFPVREAWRELWTYSIQQMRMEPRSIHYLAAIPLHNWFESLLVESGFKLNHTIIFLQWQGKTQVEERSLGGIKIRSMLLDDLPEVERVDQASFPLLWRLSQEYLAYAMQQAALTHIVQIGKEIVGYQITTTTQMGAHLARLAVHPNHQRQGIGTALLDHLLRQLLKRGISTLTVNTQMDNEASLRLYHKLGFIPTGETYPIYLFPLHADQTHPSFNSKEAPQ